jgi:transcriptional regulator GlxA family with amidase domain
MSPVHFHRVFQALVGVTVADFVKRLRLDKALFMMAHSRS